MSRSLLAATALAGMFTLYAGPARAQTDAEADAQPAASEESEVERIIVTGRAQRLYRVNEIEGGKLPVEPLLSTQTIQTINAELIEDQGARDAADLYRNFSGVSFFSYGGVTSRGFRQEETFFDGLRGDPYSGFSVPQLFNVEQAEFLKGPSGMLYGPGAPGGLFNYVTKKPGGGEGIETRAIVGTEGRYGLSAEAEAPLTDRVSGRVGAFYETRNLPRRNADNESQIYDAGLAIDLGRGELTLQATRYDQDLGGNRIRGVPADDLGFFLADRRWNHNEEDDFLRLESNVLQAKIDYQLTDELQVDAGLRWNEGTETQKYHEPFGLFDSDGDGVADSSRRQYRDQFREKQSWSFGANAIWSRSFGPVDNRLLAGADHYTEDFFFDGFSLAGGETAEPGLPTPISLDAPEYGVTDPSSYDLPDRPNFNQTRSEQARTGGYLLNEATIGRFIAVAGVRIDSFEDVNNVTGDTFEDTVDTWRAGGVYRVRDDVSVFLNWAESFEPQGIGSQDPRAGGPFDPSQGEIWEGGVRTELMDGRLQSSMAIYQIVRSNVLQADPRGDVDGDGVDDQVALGEVTSEGFEIDVSADLTPNWVLTGSYGYNDARITGDAGTNPLVNSVGDRFANAPKHMAGFWTRYQIPRFNTAVAFGGDYVDVRRSLSGQKVRPYMVFDASVIYELADWKALVRVDNLFDETYAASGFIDRTGHFPGEPRSVFFELTRRW